MRVLAVVLGALAGLIMATIALFTGGPTAAIIVLLGAVGVTVTVAVSVGAVGLRRLVRTAGVAIMAGLAFTAWQVTVIVLALTGTDGPVALADASALASAQAKFAALAANTDFRLELTEAEIEAILQDGLPDDSPLSRIRVRIVDGTPPAPGEIHVVGEFKRGGIEIRGVATADEHDGAVRVSLVSVDMGLISVTGFAAAARQDLDDAVADLNDALAAGDARVDTVVVGNGRIVVVGTRS